MVFKFKNICGCLKKKKEINESSNKPIRYYPPGLSMYDLELMWLDVPKNETIAENAKGKMVGSIFFLEAEKLFTTTETKPVSPEEGEVTNGQFQIVKIMDFYDASAVAYINVHSPAFYDIVEEDAPPPSDRLLAQFDGGAEKIDEDILEDAPAPSEKMLAEAKESILKSSVKPKTTITTTAKTDAHAVKTQAVAGEENKEKSKGSAEKADSDDQTPKMVEKPTQIDVDREIANSSMHESSTKGEKSSEVRKSKTRTRRKK